MEAMSAQCPAQAYKEGIHVHRKRIRLHVQHIRIPTNSYKRRTTSQPAEKHAAKKDQISTKTNTVTAQDKQWFLPKTDTDTAQDKQISTKTDTVTAQDKHWNTTIIFRDASSGLGGLEIDNFLFHGHPLPSFPLVYCTISSRGRFSRLIRNYCFASKK